MIIYPIGIITFTMRFSVIAPVIALCSTLQVISAIREGKCGTTIYPHTCWRYCGANANGNSQWCWTDNRVTCYSDAECPSETSGSGECSSSCG
ncbi:hypothetical protein F5H01DRAFT_329372 [Linnemannia elongata]|nr:hypothetical protein F5H01DRAFT_329372 [Linnemannia elongata]